ncbi:hypothetical protein DUI87_34092 [Hirundo rustica rustica]|uniref:PX domain-containing protein n=1 Tax=Hirundo rustica rustica TaxID=333673 RepID=A0A3M0J4A3_HIRRU|nr:hypothetical protein DUI87_34186 [Hirundo rustica rustica]RMB89518.1 hypothetical protein DUI87_34092 [Hirundo rustica rustica]
MDHLEKEIADENGALEHLKFAHEEHLNLKRDDENFMDAILKAEEVDKIKPVEYRLQSKLRQLEYLKSNHLPVLLEEKQRASEVLDRGLLGLDNTVYQIEKEIEEKEEQLAQYRASTNQLQQLQETFEFTANVARQEGKVRKKEKEILESREKQQREALEQAVAKLERRHSALQRRSTMDFEIEGQKQKLATLNNSCGKQAGLQDNERHNNSTIQRKLKYELMVCRSLGANPDDLKHPVKISIPQYVLCGQGKDEHYEFEIKITVLDETWIVFRPYSHFRELHKTLKLKYPEDEELCLVEL